MNIRFYLSYDIKITLKVSKGAKIRNQYNQVNVSGPYHLISAVKTL